MDAIPLILEAGKVRDRGSRPFDPNRLMRIDPSVFWLWCRSAWTESPSLFERHLRSLDEMALDDLIDFQLEGRTVFTGSSERLFSRFLETSEKEDTQQ